MVLIFWAEEAIFSAFYMKLEGQWWKYFGFIFLRVAGPEELVKVLAFGLSFLVFRKHYNEPLDYLIYCSLAALGFSALENYLYFQNHGPGLFVGRGILSTVGHMFDTALFAYGIILYRFRYRRRKAWLIPLFFLLSVSAHTIYNFWLLFPGVRPYGYFVTLVFFLFTISIYAVILNNALNQSKFFDYRKAINSSRLALFLLSYYAILLGVQLIFVGIESNFLTAMATFYGEFFLVGFITIVSTARLSKLQLIQGEWFPIRFELPFGVAGSMPWVNGHIKIRGYAYNAAILQSLYQSEVIFRPINRSRGILNQTARGSMDQILFFKDHRRAFHTRIEVGEAAEKHEFLVVPKLEGKNFMHDSRPIVGLVEWEERFKDPLLAKQIDLKKLKVRDWLLVYPAEVI